jgi:hypothetical protein
VDSRASKQHDLVAIDLSMKNDPIARQPSTHARSQVCGTKTAGLTPTARATSSIVFHTRWTIPPGVAAGDHKHVYVGVLPALTASARPEQPHRFEFDLITKQFDPPLDHALLLVRQALRDRDHHHSVRSLGARRSDDPGAGDPVAARQPCAL